MVQQSATPPFPVASHHIRESVFLLSVQVTAAMALFSILTIAATLLLSEFLRSDAGPFPWLSETGALFLFIIFEALLFGIEVWIMLGFILSWATTDYYITDDNLITYSGIFALDENVYDLSQLRAVHLHQSIAGKSFDYGSLELTFAVSGYHTTVHLKHIRTPKAYERVLKGYVGKERKK